MKKYLDKPARHPKHESERPHPGTTFCRQCGAVHERKRWRWDEDRRFKMSANSKLEPVICPACHMLQQGLYSGELVIDWPRLADDPKQKQELLSLLHHVEAEENTSNPLSRIASITDHGSHLEVRTTTEFLVNKLGHAIDSAFNGDLKIGPLKYEDFTRVKWTRLV